MTAAISHRSNNEHLYQNSTLKTSLQITLLAAGVLMSCIAVTSYLSTRLQLSFSLGPVGSAAFATSGFFLTLLSISLSSCVLHRKKSPIVPRGREYYEISSPKWKVSKEEFLESLSTKTKIEKLSSLQLTPIQIEELNASLVAFMNKQPIPYPHELFMGGYHVALHLQSIPHVIFKWKKNNYEFKKEVAEEYVAQADAGREICVKYLLEHLKIPGCDVYEFQGKYVVWEEYLPIQGNYSYQQGLYQCTLDHPEKRAMFLEILKELAIFICEMGMRDVQYKNIPLLLGGIIGLPDLDRQSALKGLFKGKLRSRTDGLFRYIPSEVFDEFASLVRPLLKGDELNKFNLKLPKIKEYVIGKENERKAFQDFLKVHHIEKIETPFNPSCSLEAAQQPLLEQIKKEVNDKLIKRSNNPDLAIGRTLSFGRKNNLFGSTLDQLKSVLELLKEQGHIFSYEVKDTKEVIIKC